MSDSKKSAWDGYRRWRKRFWFALPIIPVTFAVFGGSTGVAATVFIPLLIAITLFQGFKCPRCGEPFFYDRTWLPARKNCVHCGLPKWEEATFKKPQSAVYPMHGRNDSRCDLLPAEQRGLANFLTLVLRDDPGAIGLRLDSNGWASLDNLLTRANRHGLKLTRETLGDVLSASENHRFEWDQPGGRIRASTD